MTWTSIAGLLLIAVTLIGIIWFMLRGGALSPDEPRDPAVGKFSRGAFLQGLLAGVALGSGIQNAAQGSTNPWITGITCGAAVAILFALLSGTGEFKELAINVLSGLFGAIGLIVTVSEDFQPSASCSPADIGQRVLGLLVIAIALVIGGAIAWVGGLFAFKNLGATILALFGALEVVDFLSSPIGLALVDLGVSALVISLVAAFAFGFAASIWPQFTITIASLVVVAGGVIGTVSGSANTLCMPGTDISGVAPLIGYIAFYFGLRRIIRTLVRPNEEAEVKS